MNTRRRIKTVMTIAIVAMAVMAQANTLEDELGILDLTANGGINPATGAPWAEGDTYRFAFFTSVGRTAESADIADYNAWVQGLANATSVYDIGANEGVTWKVIASTSAIDARDNTSTNPGVDGTGESIFLLDGSTVVANDYADLWDGKIQHIIDRTELGTLYTWWPWTGTNLSGTKTGPLGNGGQVVQGNSSVTTEWIWRTNTYDPPNLEHNMYALSEPLFILSVDPTLPDVDAGSDWITWSGASVTLDDVVVVSNDPGALTYAWSADPGAGVVFDPNEFVEAPMITITKAAGDPITVTFTLAVNNLGSGNPDEADTMTIDVYDNSCLAAKAIGTVAIDPTDFNDDCMTNFEDIAELASRWLVDYKLTDPAAEL